MSARLLLLDAGHGWKGVSTGYDPGAIVPGVETPDGFEAVIVRHLRALLEVELRRRAAQVHIIAAEGPYSDRHREAARVVQDAGVERAIYVQLHVNAGNGAYALVEHDARSPRGAMIAATLADHLGGLAEVSEGRTAALRGGDRGHVCIEGIWPIQRCSAVLVEPLFIDADDHRLLLSQAGLVRVAVALAEGLIEALAAP